MQEPIGRTAPQHCNDKDPIGRTAPQQCDKEEPMGAQEDPALEAQVPGVEAN